MNAYKVSICKSSGWRGFEACTLGVSVTSPNWQDERFASILAFAAINFKTIRIDVTDLLYRAEFMAEGMPPRDAEAHANALGTSWLERHQPLIEACPVRPDIIRWGTWYGHPDYASTLEQVQHAYDNSPVLRAAVQSDVEVFFRLRGREPTNIECEHSRNFLLEEMAVLTLQARDRSGRQNIPRRPAGLYVCSQPGPVPEAPGGLEREQFAQVNLRSRSAVEAAQELFARPAPGFPNGSIRPPIARGPSFESRRCGAARF